MCIVIFSKLKHEWMFFFFLHNFRRQNVTNTFTYLDRAFFQTNNMIFF